MANVTRSPRTIADLGTVDVFSTSQTRAYIHGGGSPGGIACFQLSSAWNIELDVLNYISKLFGNPRDTF